jgi:hypothetical protein
MLAGAANVPVIADLALRHRPAGTYDERQYVTAGGLMTYRTQLRGDLAGHGTVC